MSTDDPRGPAEPYRPPPPRTTENEPTGPVRVPPTPTRPEPARPSTAEPAATPPARSTPAPAAPPAQPPRAPAAGEPPAAPRGPSDLDEFLARAVDRQIAEQRALREAMQELTNAVRELEARPSAGPSFDPAELEARIARAMSSGAKAAPPFDPAELEARIARAVSTSAPRAAVDPAELEGRIARAMAQSSDVIVNELRDLRSTVLPGLQRATEASSGSRGIEHDMAILRDAMSGLSADVEGIAQALIDLNAGLRDWADGIDRNIEIVKETVQHVRDAATRAEELSADAAERQRRSAEDLPMLPDESDLSGVGPHAPRDVSSEIEQRVKETVELSLYLADQIEAFDRSIANLGDLPTRLEGVISQALKRTLAARAKLDRDAEMALDEAVATLDEHVATIGDLSSVAEMQARLEAGLDAIAEAIDRSADGDLPRAGTSLAKASARKTSSKKRAKTKSRAKPKAKAATSKRTTRSSSAKRSAPKRKRKPPEAGYLSLDADTLDDTDAPPTDGD